jgi:hypothetical protein
VHEEATAGHSLHVLFTPICFGPENIQVSLPMHKQQTEIISYTYTAYENNKFFLSEIEFYILHMHAFSDANTYSNSIRSKQTPVQGIRYRLTLNSKIINGTMGLVQQNVSKTNMAFKIYSFLITRILNERLHHRFFSN